MKTNPAFHALKSVLFLSITATSLWSCSCDDDSEPANAQNCIENPSDNTYWGSCEVSPLSSICETEYIGDFTLSEKSKVFFPQFCKTAGQNLVFENPTGDTIQFRVTHRGYERNRYLIRSSEHCPGDSSKFLGFCVVVEEAFLVVNSTSHNLKFIIQLKNYYDWFNIKPGEVGDVIQIYRMTDTNSFDNEFLAIIDQKGLSKAAFSTQQTIPELTLGGKVYKNVITDLDFFSDYKFYVNNEYGVFAFEDEDDVLWILKQ